MPPSLTSSGEQGLPRNKAQSPVLPEWIQQTGPRGFGSSAGRALWRPPRRVTAQPHPWQTPHKTDAVKKAIPGALHVHVGQLAFTG